MQSTQTNYTIPGAENGSSKILLRQEVPKGIRIIASVLNVVGLLVIVSSLISIISFFRNEISAPVLNVPGENIVDIINQELSHLVGGIIFLVIGGNLKKMKKWVLLAAVVFVGIFTLYSLFAIINIGQALFFAPFILPFYIIYLIGGTVILVYLLRFLFRRQS